MEPVDLAFQQFKRLRVEVSTYRETVHTEADTRLKIIDPVFKEVLQWPFSEVLAEAPTTSGFADYAFQVNGRTRLIVEAKKDRRSFGCEARTGGRSYKLSGGAFAGADVKEGIAQAIRYCGEKSAELACVTNGSEWVVFRGNRLGDGLDIRDGVAFVFPNLTAIEENFPLFYDLLSYESATKFSFRPFFNEAEGQPIRTTIFQKSIRPPGSARFLQSEDLSADIDRVLTTFFRRLSGDQDPDLLDACFVDTNESYHAERQIARLAENMVTRLRELDTDKAEPLVDLIRRVREYSRHEFVLLVGAKGAGKSTFVSRFFSTILAPAIREHCVLLQVDLRSAQGDKNSVVDWLNKALIKQAEDSLFDDGAPTFAEIQGMFFDEYKRLKRGPLHHLYETNKSEFYIRFGERVESIRASDPHEYIKGILRNIVNGRTKLPVLIFDNADHFSIDFQQTVYQYARSLYEPTLCLIILPVTDRTSWQLSRHGALQSFEHEALFLPAPPTEQIIRKRIEFLEKQVETHRARPDDRYFIGRGISLSIDDLGAFAQTLQRVFLQTSNVAGWIGALANYNVRKTLELAREFVTSPHLRVLDLLKTYVARTSVDVPQNRAVKALVRGQYDIYPASQHNFVQNIYALNGDLATTPLLGLRILQLLSDVPSRDLEGALIDVDDVIAYSAGMNLENRAVYLWLDEMLKAGLLLSYDPTIEEIAGARQIEISPAGRQHLYWGTGNFEYISAMADVTPLLSEIAFEQMKEDLRGPGGWRQKTVTFLGYLVAEDEQYCLPPEHPSYESQRRIRTSLRGTESRLRAMLQPRTA